MVTVSVSETYDLSTKPNKMSLIAIKTPSKNLIKKTYPGLAVNHRFFKFLHCDVKLACASLLPADPLQIGTSAGSIAPQDMFNPILYKAVTSEGLSTLEYRLLGMGQGAYGNNDMPVVGESVIAQNANATGQTDEFNTYYGLLSNRDGFKVAHPQAGLEMRGLVPLVYEKLFQFGQDESLVNSGNSQIESLQSNSTGDALALGYINNRSIKGSARPLPRMNTTWLDSFGAVDFGFASENLTNWQGNMPDIPSCYVAMIVMPPSKLNVLYFRLHVRWFIQFSDPRPIGDILAFTDLGTIGSNFYTTDYTFSKGTPEYTEMDMLEAKDADITKIMEGA